MNIIDEKIFYMQSIIDKLNLEIENRKYLNRDYYEARGKLYGYRIGLSQFIDLKKEAELLNK